MNITYLLGAGASYNALPVVNQISDKLEEFIYKLRSERRSVPLRLSNEEKFLDIHGSEKIDGKLKTEIYDDFISSLEWLKDENDKHFSIDTFAKKLYLQRDWKNLKRLKITLACFFVYLQNSNLDNRYDSFFAAILDDLKELPQNIKILSWNYDYQLEIAFSNFIQNCDLISNQNHLNVYTKGDDLVNLDLYNKFSVFKLNGTTSLTTKVHICDNINENEVKLINDIITYYDVCSKPNADLTFSFAWENDDKKFIKHTGKYVSNTDVLIVIGYSFPFFNRKIDSSLFESMSLMKEIYIQDPYQGETIKERVEAIAFARKTARVPNVKLISMKDQFYIPFNY